MDNQQREHLEQRLLKERQRAVKAVRQLEDNSSDEEDGGLTNYPFHLADEGTNTIEQEQSFLLRSQEGRLLYDIDEALRTLYKQPERYGKCSNCNGEVSFERLDIVPWTQYCKDCQEMEERKAPVEAA